jgi:alpha-tubulin suppressor-like RCC1 family protein
LLPALVAACAASQSALGDAAPLPDGEGPAAPDAAPGSEDGGAILHVAEVAAGVEHVCVRGTEGAVCCWGQNEWGQLGNGSTAASTEPVRVPGLESQVVQLSAGAYHTCARLQDGTLSCWGENRSGQLGNGSGVDLMATPTPVVGLGGPAAQVSAGNQHTCARLGDGTVRCWGDDSDGQLGNGVIEARTGGVPVPTPVLNLTPPASDLSVGSLHSCGVGASLGGTGSGWVYCWGQNGNGQVGVGFSGPVPIAVPPVGLPGVTVSQVSSGTDHACALAASGAVYCWGSNQSGELGAPTAVGSPDIASFRVEVTSLGGAAASVSAGQDDTCAVKRDGTLWCWGRNAYGEVGDGTREPARLPVQVQELGNQVASVQVGYWFVCARTQDGILYCWGDNRFGLFGDPGQQMVPHPHPLRAGLACRSGPG